MKRSITIHYQPLIVPTTQFHTRRFSVNEEELSGIVIIAQTITLPDRISIVDTNGEQFDITRASNLPNFGYRPGRYKYTAKLLTDGVSFDTLDFIQAAIQVCLLFGIDPGSIITDIQEGTLPIKIDFHRYFGTIPITNDSPYPDGSTVGFDELSNVLSLELRTSLESSYRSCFPDVSVGITVPSELYMVTSDESRTNVLTSCIVTNYIPDEVGAHTGAYYIFNVCAISEIRGQGLAKSIMVTMLNDLMGRGVTKFILEVLPTNTVAYTLYTSLGFERIATTYQGEYDILMLEPIT